MLRWQIGQGGTVDPEAQTALNQGEQWYYVVVTGVPGQFGGLMPEALMADSRLEREGKSPIVPVEARPEMAGRDVMLVYIFPKDDAIVLEDKDVEFVTKVGDRTIKKKFKLEDMVFNDQLEL